MSGKVIVIGGGSCTGKTTLAQNLAGDTTPYDFRHVDFDNTINPLLDRLDAPRDNTGKKQLIISTFPKFADVADTKNVVIPVPFPDSFAAEFRKALIRHSVLNIWLYCSSMKEHKRRAAERLKVGDGRVKDVEETGQNKPKLQHDEVLDTAHVSKRDVLRKVKRAVRNKWG